MQFHTSNQASCHLRHPLYQLMTNVMKPLAPIIFQYQFLSSSEKFVIILKIIGNIIALIICIIPVSILYFIGKIIYLANSSRLDLKGLTKTPKPIKIPPNDNTNTGMYKIIELAEQSRELLRTEPGKTSLAACLINAIIKIINYNEDICPDSVKERDLFCSQARGYFNEIGQFLADEKTPIGIKNSYLGRLAALAQRCNPTWLEESRKIYNEISMDHSEFENAVLTYVQEYKEDLVLEFVQDRLGSQWHALTWARTITGDDLGLDSAGIDVYGGEGVNPHLKNLFKWFFFQKYENTHKLIEFMRIKLNRIYHSNKDVHDTTVVEFITKQFNKDNFTFDNFFDNRSDGDDPDLENTRLDLNYEGAYFILRTIGILT